ncbi:MAG: class I SAM-dependent methyltransferase [Firmicutes bacterium]|nr:class I SAM-dependent methyltransferase [Bacillota bacterium]
MFKLNDEYLIANYSSFICSYGDVCVNEIISRESFVPETFFVSQKLKNEEILFFRDISFREWVVGMINDIIKNMNLGYDQDKATDMAYENVLYLLAYNDSADKIANQEFVDVIRRVIAYTLTGDVDKEIHTANMFNALAAKYLPLVINQLREYKLSAKELLLYSIVSGLSGLDLKGAPAAASSYANEGIKMAEYTGLDSKTAAKTYLESLTTLYNKTQISIFDWDDFIQLIIEKKKLVWMTDDYIESYFDLLFLTALLDEYEIFVEIIPKNGYHGNDLSYKDLQDLLATDLFEDLKKHLNSGRLSISWHGPKMGAANIYKLSGECIDSIKKAGLLFAKGCRIFEMLQGGLNIDWFTSFYVVRSLSEITSGLLAEQNEAVFLHLAPKEYAFFGVVYENSRQKVINGKPVTLCASTVYDHRKRKTKAKIEEIVEEFHYLRHIETAYCGDIYPVQMEMNMLAKKIEEYTAEQYSKSSRMYAKLARPDMSKIDSLLWELLVSKIKEILNKEPKEISLLEIGVGDGRALEYASYLGINALGIDNSAGFIELLQEKATKGLIPPHSFLFANMCALPIENRYFDVIRMNASLLHMPIIGAGFTVDLALCETKRVLRPGGLLFVMVKKGQGISLIDTQEGLGKRFYQLYTRETLHMVLKRNGFNAITMVEQEERRGNDVINWVVCIAQK